MRLFSLYCSEKFSIKEFGEEEKNLLLPLKGNAKFRHGKTELQICDSSDLNKLISKKMMTFVHSCIFLLNTGLFICSCHWNSEKR